MKLITKYIRNSSVNKFLKKKGEKLPFSLFSEDKNLINKLISYIEYLKEELKDAPSHGSFLSQYCDYKLAKSYFEQIIDALILEIYYPEELHKHNKYFKSHILKEDLPSLKDIEENTMETLKNISKKIFNKEHPIRIAIFFLNSVPIVRQIRGLR